MFFNKSYLYVDYGIAFRAIFSKKYNVYCNKRYGCINYVAPHKGLQINTSKTEFGIK